MAKSRFKAKGKKKPIPTTRVSVVVIDNGGKILLVKHRKGNRSYWVLPGGRLEHGESFKECAVREIKEETGLDIEVERFLFLSEAIAPDRSRHIVNIFTKGKVVGGTIKLGDEPVLAGVDFKPVEDLASLNLFPPVGEAILECFSNNFSKGIKYLGNIWM